MSGELDRVQALVNKEVRETAAVDSIGVLSVCIKVASRSRTVLPLTSCRYPLSCLSLPGRLVSARYLTLP